MGFSWGMFFIATFSLIAKAEHAAFEPIPPPRPARAGAPEKCEPVQVAYKDKTGADRTVVVWKSVEGKIFFAPTVEPKETRYYPFFADGKGKRPWHDKTQYANISVLYDVDFEESEESREALAAVRAKNPSVEIVNLFTRGGLSFQNFPQVSEKLGAVIEKIGEGRYTFSYDVAGGQVNESLFAGPNGILFQGSYPLPCRSSDGAKAVSSTVGLRSTAGKVSFINGVYGGRVPFTRDERLAIRTIANKIEIPKVGDKFSDAEFAALKELLMLESRHMSPGVLDSVCGFFGKPCKDFTWDKLTDEMIAFFKKNQGESLIHYGLRQDLDIGGKLTASEWAEHRATPAHLSDLIRTYLRGNRYHGVAVAEWNTAETNLLVKKRSNSLSESDGMDRDSITGRPTGKRLTTEPPFAAYDWIKRPDELRFAGEHTLRIETNDGKSHEQLYFPPGKESRTVDMLDALKPYGKPYERVY